jgi:hypothetical protein
MVADKFDRNRRLIGVANGVVDGTETTATNHFSNRIFEIKFFPISG